VRGRRLKPAPGGSPLILHRLEELTMNVLTMDAYVRQRQREAQTVARRATVARALRAERRAERARNRARRAALVARREQERARAAHA
jgi:hypothetical protein